MNNIKNFANFINEGKLGITKGQDKDIKKYFGDYNIDKSYIIAEGGNDNGKTFRGSFLVHIHNKGDYRFTDGEMVKKVK